MVSNIIIATLVGFLFAHHAFADTALKGILTAQPQIMMKDGKVDGCGVRIIGMEETTSMDARVSNFDVSFALYANGIAGLKGLALDDVSMRDVAKAKAAGKTLSLKYVPLESFWIKSPVNSATTPINGKVLSGENRLSLLYVASFPLVAELFQPVFDQTTIQVGIKRKSDKVGYIYFGVPMMSKEELKQLSMCIDEFKSNLTSEEPLRK